MSEQYEYVPHRLLRRRVRDIASGVEGELMAVVNENVSDGCTEHWVELAYIRGASGREFSTSVANVEPVDRAEPSEARDQPRASVGRGHGGARSD
ncbi:hypothetical protein [Streptomyces sp. NPDC006459]|uniref:hypothetical protein n=1 Tax=Streptomyces sp. NPDC006459 TaxID=3154303 RepID=UPI0033B8C3EC